jgi:hypothetical protein
MSVSALRLSLGGLSFLAVCAAGARAQESPPAVSAPEIRGGTGTGAVESVLHVTYDVRQDRTTTVRAASAGALGFGTAICFDNSDVLVPDDPQYPVALIGQDLLNWGFKFCPGASLLRRFTFAYRSEALDTSAGGPGAAFSFALHRGATGFGDPGTEIFRRTFTGLPSRGAPASDDVVYFPFGQSAPMVFFTIDFGVEPLPLDDGPFGWSFLQLDGDTGPVLVRAPRALLGTFDAMDIYGPGPAVAANYLGTFNYGGCDGTSLCANMFVQLDEIRNDEVASSTVVNGSGVNPVSLSEVLPARLGGTWAASVSATPPSGANPPATLLFVSASALPAVATPWGEVLVHPGLRLAPPIPGEGGYALAIPADVTLAGISFHAQAALVPPTVPTLTLTNALRVRMGF